MPAPLASEEIEPFAARIIGVLFSAVTEAKETGDRWELHDAYMNLWWGIQGLEKVAVALRGGRESKDPSCLHFSIAVNNHIIGITRMIQEDLGIDPTKEPGWKVD